MKIIAIGLIFFLSLNAYAVDWRLAVTSKAYNIYLDADSFRDFNGNRRGWLMTINSKEQVVNGVKYKTALELLEVDCKERRTKSLAGVIRTGEMERGEAVGGFDNSDTAKWTAVVPGTVGETQAHIICNHPMK